MKQLVIFYRSQRLRHYHKTVEKGHGRIETREYWLVCEDSFEMKDEWGGLKSVGMVKSERMIDGVSSHETRSEERRVGKECRSRWSPYH